MFMLFMLLRANSWKCWAAPRMCAVPNMAVFRSSMISCFPVVLLRYFLNDFEIVPVTSNITGITSVFTFHIGYISIVRSLDL